MSAVWDEAFVTNEDSSTVWLAIDKDLDESVGHLGVGADLLLAFAAGLVAKGVEISAVVVVSAARETFQIIISSIVQLGNPSWKSRR